MNDDRVGFLRMIPGSPVPLPTQRAHPTAWLWFIVGGAFIVVPGLVILYILNLPASIELASADPSTAALWILDLSLFVVPAALLVAAGSLAIAFGLRRRASARS